MSRRVVSVAGVVAVLAAAILVGAASGASAVNTCLRGGSTSCAPRFELPTLRGRVSPQLLPKREVEPVALFLAARFADTDLHTSALREAVVSVDNDLAVDAKGIPACRGGTRDVRRTLKDLLRACRPSLVGRGKAEFAYAPSLDSARLLADLLRPSPVLVFYAGGPPRMPITLVAVGVPASGLAAARIEIRRTGPGRNGWTARVEVPVLAGGSGSLTALSLRLGREFIHRGKRKSFLSARCPDGKIEVSVPKAEFRNEAEVPGVAAGTVIKGGFVIPCTPQR